MELLGLNSVLTVPNAELGLTQTQEQQSQSGLG